MDLNGTIWSKSSRSGNNGGDCVEVANLDRVIGVRDSKNPDGPNLGLARADWYKLMIDVRDGRYDL